MLGIQLLMIILEAESNQEPEGRCGGGGLRFGGVAVFGGSDALADGSVWSAVLGGVEQSALGGGQQHQPAATCLLDW